MNRRTDFSDPERLKSFGPTERQEWITEYILENGSVLVDELVELFGVSRMTIHRDLDDLEQQGILRKVRSGATALPSNLFESDVRYRLKHQLEEKEAIAKVAITFVESGQAIFMDEATSLLPLAQLLPTVAPVTVITNFLPIIKELTQHKGIRLIALGGEYLPRFDTFTGLLTEQAVSSLRADLYFTSVTATSGGVLYHPDQQIVKVKQMIMARASRNIILLDHTKFGKIALHRLAPIQSFDIVVVDSRIEETHYKQLLETGVRVEVAPVEER